MQKAKYGACVDTSAFWDEVETHALRIQERGLGFLAIVQRRRQGVGAGPFNLTAASSEEKEARAAEAGADGAEWLMRHFTVDGVPAERAHLHVVASLGLEVEPVRIAADGEMHAYQEGELGGCLPAVRRPARSASTVVASFPDPTLNVSAHPTAAPCPSDDPAAPGGQTPLRLHLDAGVVCAVRRDPALRQAAPRLKQFTSFGNAAAEGACGMHCAECGVLPDGHAGPAVHPTLLPFLSGTIVRVRLPNGEWVERAANACSMWYDPIARRSVGPGHP